MIVRVSAVAHSIENELACDEPDVGPSMRLFKPLPFSAHIHDQG